MVTGTRWLVDALVVVSVAAAGVLVPRLARRTPPSGGGRAPGPEAVLAAAVACLYVNQVLFTVYVTRTHGGDPSFVSRYLPPGWFAMADGPPLRWLAARFPAPWLLAPTVLRVQAFLELPFVLLVFAVALRWLDAELCRRVLRPPLLWAASGTWTAVFCVVERDLRNPYTTADLVIRLVSGCVTPPALAALAARARPGPRPARTATGLLLLGASLALLGYLVLTVYGTALLYNLGLLGARLPGAATALAALVAVRALAARCGGGPGAPAGGAVAAVTAWLTRALTWFLVPALPVRYALGFGTPWLAAAAAVAVAVAAGLPVVSPAFRRGGPLPGLAGSAALAVPAAALAARAAGGGYPEARLLAAAAAFLAVLVAGCAAWDRLTARRTAR